MRAARSRWRMADFCRGTFRAQMRQDTECTRRFGSIIFGSIILRPRIPEAIHLSVQEVTMDCFASLAMTVDTVSPSRDALRPRFAEIPFPPTRGRREDRVRAAPAVSCAMCTKKCAHEHTGPAESIRPSLRNGLTAYGALSPETNSFCLRHRRIDGFANPVGLAKTSADLTPATGARTTRFCR